jgi:hypothetical protein
MRLPILHIQQSERDDAPPGPEAIDALARALTDRGVEPVGIVELLCGAVCSDTEAPRLLVTTGETRLGRLSMLLEGLSTRGIPLLVAVDRQSLFEGPQGSLRAADLPVLLGAGGVIAARGARDKPLVGLAPGGTREELTASRDALSDAAGYPIHWLLPRPNALGKATDRLVLDEAQRAGFLRCLAPRPGRTNTFEAGSVPFELGYHVWGPSDTPKELARWAAGSLLGRGTTGLKSLLDAPSRIMSRFEDPSHRPTD